MVWKEPHIKGNIDKETKPRQRIKEKMNKLKKKGGEVEDVSAPIA